MTPDFIGACISGKASPDEIDRYVEAWHRDPAGTELNDFLGMTDEEYGLWVSEPDALTRIIVARRRGTSLFDAVA
jgi:hypothetical protein